jgi:hypothetical protein
MSLAGSTAIGLVVTGTVVQRLVRSQRHDEHARRVSC